MDICIGLNAPTMTALHIENIKIKINPLKKTKK